MPDTQLALFMAVTHDDLEYIDGVAFEPHDVQVVRGIINRSPLLNTAPMATGLLLDIEQHHQKSPDPEPTIEVEILDEELEDEQILVLEKYVKQKAACDGKDTKIFFPTEVDASAYARSICASCIVRWECVYVRTLQPREIVGVYGGLHPKAAHRVKTELPKGTDFEATKQYIIENEAQYLDPIAEWDIEHGVRRYLNRLDVEKGDRASLATLRTAARTARIIMDQFRGQVVSRQAIDTFLKGRDDINTVGHPHALDTIFKKGLSPDAYSLRPGGLYQFAETEGYAPFEY